MSWQQKTRFIYATNNERFVIIYYHMHFLILCIVGCPILLLVALQKLISVGRWPSRSTNGHSLYYGINKMG